ncbi:MAG TPA: STM3941 family protein [Chitinophagaceae bacterium]|nr:STM3941 family protein [Chitinophagaceae bacterium]
MPSEQRIEIPLSKLKLVLMLMGALAFVAIGFWFVLAPPDIDSSFWRNPARIAFAGYASIIFFGLCGVVIVRKLFDRKPGLIIDSKGVIDNSSGLSAGYILWTDVENISVVEIQKQRLLMLEVKNPQDYINRQGNLLKRKGMEFNDKMFGTPLSITANGLKISFEELSALVKQKFLESRI